MAILRCEARAQRWGRRIRRSVVAAAWLAVAPGSLAGLVGAGAPPAHADVAGAGSEERSFTWHPSLRVGGVYDDNVYFEPEDRVATGAARVQPRLDAEWVRGRLRAGGEVGGDVWWYPALAEQSDAFLRVGAFAEYELLRGLRLRLANLYAPQPVFLSRPADDVGNWVQSNRAEAALRWRREMARETALEAAVVGTRFDGDSTTGLRATEGEGVVAEDDRFRPDFSEGAASLELQRGFGRRTLAYVRAEGRERTYDDIPESSFAELGGLGGVRFRGPGKTQLELASGYGTVDYREGGTQPHWRALAEARGEMGAGFAWRMGAERRFASDAALDDYVENTFWLGLDKPLGERTTLSLAFIAGIADDSGSEVSAPRWRGGSVELKRRLSRHVQAGVAYRRFVSDESRGVRDTKQNRVTLELEYRR